MYPGHLKIGILGCGAISQFAHIPAVLRSRFAELIALCDCAEDLLQRVGSKAGVDRLYTNFSAMLADESVQAVIIAVPDSFHVPLAIRALQAGKHVLVEKPMGETSEQCRKLIKAQRELGLKVQVGSMKRHDPGVRFAQEFLSEKCGPVFSVSAVYRDTVFRRAMQETCLDPLLTSEAAIRPQIDPKANPAEYNFVTQGVHLFDTINYLAGHISAVSAITTNCEGNWSWHGSLEFTKGGCGHFELTCKACGDWCERYEIHSHNGSVQVNVSLPFYHRPAQVRAFDGKLKQWSTPLGAHSNAYANQIDNFARAVIEDTPTNPDVYDGLSAVQSLEAVRQSIETGKRTRIEQYSACHESLEMP